MNDEFLHAGDVVQHIESKKVGTIDKFDLSGTDVWVDGTGPYPQSDFIKLVPESKAVSEAKERVEDFVFHLKMASSIAKMKAQPNSKFCLGILAKNPDGTGQVGATFEGDPFLSDLELILGMKNKP